jgi:hypothetical protein
MKNKLLLTTALIGSVALAGAAQSEIKIGGSQEITFGASSVDSSTAADNGKASARGLGNETNLNISGSMDLDNGISIVSKYNLEFDTAAKKEVSVQFNMGDAFFVIANDMTQGLNSISAPRVGDHPSTIAGRGAATAYTDGQIENNFDDHVALGFKVAGGNVVALYAPNAQLNGNDDGAVSGLETGSGYTISYKGSPVEGLTIGLATAEKQSANTNVTKDIEADKAMISYTMGAVTAGVEYSDKDTNTTSGNLKSMSYGVTFNAADNLSIGLGYAVTEDDDAGNTNPDEKISLITLGYNLGGLGIELSYADTSDAANTSGNDTQVFQARTVVAF